MIGLGRRLSVLLIGVTVGGALLAGVATAASAAPTAPAAMSASRASADLVAATNAARREAGCAPVQSDERLRGTAQAHATDMARNDYFSHTSQDGTTSGERIAEDGGYPHANAENIASGYPSAAEVMRVWMDSPSHRQNIVDCTYTAIGVGYVGDGHHWVQDFGGR